MHSSMSRHSVPLPMKPASQLQVKLPTVLTQEACSAQLSSPSAHSSTSLQPEPEGRPSPAKPGKHWQLKEPTSLLHNAFALHGAPDAHSLMSVQLTPFPLNPPKQTHVKLPGVSMQVACTLQFAEPVWHSSMLVQV